MKRRKYLASVLVFLQFSCIGIAILANGIMAQSWAGKVVQAMSAILLLYAVIAMKLENLRISPVVKENAEMRVSGPYRLIRHPMYVSVLGYTFPLTLHHFTLLNIVVSTLLLGVLLVKLNFEEKLLEEKFPGYTDYKSVTWRILPFIY